MLEESKEVSIKLLFKQFIVRMLLVVLRGLIFVKRHGGPFLKTVSFPFVMVWRFLVSLIGLPVYRLSLVMRRHVSRFLQPAKHRVVYLVSNRYAVHATVVAIALLTGAMNFGGQDVRAETFGQESMLYQLVSQNDFQTVEVVSASSTPVVQATSYMNDTVVDVNAHIDTNYIDEAYVTTKTGVDVFMSPTIYETDMTESFSAPERSEVVMYAVEEGDVLGTIAEKHGLSLSTILWANDLTIRSVINPGLELMIPPVDGVVYTVKNGDTLSSISRNYGVDVDRILSYNNLSATSVLSIGAELVLPEGEPPSSYAPVTRTAPVTSLFTGTASPRGSSYGNGTWVWPATWRVITQYYGWRHTGLDVDGDYTTDSIATRDGVVIFSGWRNGYGLTVELDHGDGYMTRYAHHSRNYVSVGEYVTAGQPIAQCGTTGRSTGTHLHFEIIKNGQFLNPLDYVR